MRLGSYWGNESINLTGIVGMTNNMINPLRLFQERRTRQNCPELNHDPINVGLTRWSRNFPDKGADTHSSPFRHGLHCCTVASKAPEIPADDTLYPAGHPRSR